MGVKDAFQNARSFWISDLQSYLPIYAAMAFSPDMPDAN